MSKSILGSARCAAERVNRLLDAGDFGAARQVIGLQLKRNPNDHWFLMRLGFAHSAEGRYLRALQATTRALALAPKCAAALSEHADNLAAAGRTKEAIRIYRSLIRRGASCIAYGECGEGLRWAKSLINDCRFGLAEIYNGCGDRRRAKYYLKKYLGSCRGLFTTYPRQRVRKVVDALSSTGDN